MSRPDSYPRLAHVPALDGVRGLAILLVLSWHCLGDLVEPGAFFGAGLVRRFTSLGWSGVQLFFVLSGYLITSRLLAGRAGSFSALVPYFIRRAFRILPAYSLLLAVYVALLVFGKSLKVSLSWWLENPMPLASYFTFTQNLFMAAAGTFGARFLSPTWSLAVEEQFYLFLPWALLTFRYPRSLAFPLGMIGFGTACRVLTPGWADVVLPTSALDALGGGALIAFVQRRAEIWDWLVKRRSAVAACGVILWAGIVVMTFEPSVFWKFNNLWLAASYSWLVLACLIGGFPRLQKVMCIGLLRYSGKISYSLYLFHYPVTAVVFLACGLSIPSISGVNSLCISVASVGISFLVAALVYTVIEAPFVRVGHELARRRASAVVLNSECERGLNVRQ